MDDKDAFRPEFSSAGFRCDLAELVHAGGLIDRNRAAFVLRRLPASPHSWPSDPKKKASVQRSYGLTDEDVRACNAFNRKWCRLLDKIRALKVVPGFPLVVDEVRQDTGQRYTVLRISGSVVTLDDCMRIEPCG